MQTVRPIRVAMPIPVPAEGAVRVWRLRGQESIPTEELTPVQVPAVRRAALPITEAVPVRAHALIHRQTTVTAVRHSTILRGAVRLHAVASARVVEAVRAVMAVEQLVREVVPEEDNLWRRIILSGADDTDSHGYFSHLNPNRSLRGKPCSLHLNLLIHYFDREGI